jgi:hypothetical protein
MRDTVEREPTGSSKGLLQDGLDVARRQATQERDHQRLERVAAHHVLAQRDSKPSFDASRTRGLGRGEMPARRP